MTEFERYIGNDNDGKQRSMFPAEQVCSVDTCDNEAEYRCNRCNTYWCALDAAESYYPDRQKCPVCNTLLEDI